MHVDRHFVAYIRTCALLGLCDGISSPQYWDLIKKCGHIHYPSGTVLIYTRNRNFYASGWIYCWHLSLSFFDPVTQEDVPQRRKLANLWCELLFGRDNMRRLLVELPSSLEEKSKDIWHYRLFVDQHWRPITPTGEPFFRQELDRGDL